jgi:DNA repair protein RadA/Sms
LKEAAKLGFARAVVPDAGRGQPGEGLRLSEVGSLAALVSEIAASGRRAKSA